MGANPDALYRLKAQRNAATLVGVLAFLVASAISVPRFIRMYRAQEAVAGEIHAVQDRIREAQEQIRRVQVDLGDGENAIRQLERQGR